jgi:hypothetical protein
MAWCFALYGFWTAPATTADRIAAMVKMLALQANRIAGNIGYAVSQKNNHALSEAVGLLTTAWLFPELREATRWETTGRRVLEKEVRRQVYDDGSYVQQSMNYHRVMLHDCVWAIRLAESNGQPFSPELRRRVAGAAAFLFQMVDPDTGRVPNYGANDGTLVLPLNSCDYTDYRPVVQSCGYLSRRERPYPSGDWDEDLVWLFGPEALRSPVSDRKRASIEFPVGGYYTLRGPQSWCVVRCHAYRDRPNHVDPLHVDLWYRGVNVLSDSGTYRYYVPEDPAFERYFKDIGAHNTIELDDRGPLDLFSRFLWLPWPGAKCLVHRRDRWQGEHYAYNRAPWHVVHRRGVERVDEHIWLVNDELVGQGKHTVKLYWHLTDGPVRLYSDRQLLEVDLPCGRVALSLEGPPGLEVEVHRGLHQPERIRGWMSSYYTECAPRPTLEVSGCCDLPARLVTRIQLGKDGQ